MIGLEGVDKVQITKIVCRHHLSTMSTNKNGMSTPFVDAETLVNTDKTD